MQRTRNRLATAFLATAIAASLGACGGGSSKKDNTNNPPKPSTADVNSRAEKARAFTARDKWNPQVDKLNIAIARYGRDEPAHAHANDVLAVRRDGYDYRNAIYKFDIQVRKIKFPETMLESVNALLKADGRIIAALDGMSQSSHTQNVDKYIRQANAVDLTGAVDTVASQLKAATGEKPSG
jgi:hypothetical protein